MNNITLTKPFAFQRLFYFLLFIISCQLAHAALPDFTLTVTKTDVTCPANGTLTFNVSGQAAGSSIIYKIYHLPDAVNPIATLSGNSLGGLSAGNYRVVATQTLGAESNSQQKDVTILNNIVPLTYTVSGQNAVCGNDGQIVVSVTQGTAVSYELFSGPVIKPLQPSNVFDGLSAGNYQIRVFDGCGEGVVQDFVLLGSTPNLVINPTSIPEPELPGCDLIKVFNSIGTVSGSIIAYPIDIEYTINPPTGPAIVQTATVFSGSPTNYQLSQVIPFYYNQPYSYNIKVTDHCGNVYVRNNNIVNEKLELTVTAPPVGCNDKKIVVSPANFVGPFTVAFLLAPAGFNPLTYNAAHPGPFGSNPEYYNPGVQLIPGDYTVQVTDACGRTATAAVHVEFDAPPASITAFIQQGCDVGFGAIQMVCSGATLVSATIISAPAAYGAVPSNVSFNISDSGVFSMNSLPTGTYVIKTVDSCNNEKNTTVNLIPLLIFSNINSINPGCNSFDLTLHHSDNLLQPSQYWLQKLDPATGLWGHPQTGFTGPVIDATTALAVNNNATNLNLAYTGSFRVMMTFTVFGNAGAPAVKCSNEVYTFEYTMGPKINSISAFSCSPDASDVLVDATGIAPLIYRITTKDGQPFLLENGNNSVFAGLAPAVYNFQVEDSCGNILNSPYDVTTPISLSITPVALCDGQPGSLTMPPLPFLNYSWWKDNDTATILSTTNVLSFPSFNSATQAGTYHVHISYPNANSCIDQTLDFVISPNLNNPNAGTGNTVAYCGGQGNIDLFTQLTGTFDNFGIWTETSNSGGALTDNIFNSDIVSPGTYTFKYTVSGLCNVTDVATVNITINAVPETPVAFLEQDTCSGQELHLLATAITSGVYQWTGPNGFTSSEQNPVIANASIADSGVYSVQAVNGSCPSGISTVTVAVLPSTEFTIDSGCIGNDYVMTVLPIDNSFDPTTASYTWTGPDNFAANTNSVVISGLPAGTYSVTVTRENACPQTLDIPVPGTLCGIPKGVSVNGDDLNDDWDLSGLDIDHVKIFNRYGMMVYEKAHYLNEWHGQDYLGHNLPSATYYYLATMPTGEQKTGWVYLIRKE